jgi:hypothetical protein
VARRCTILAVTAGSRTRFPESLAGNLPPAAAWLVQVITLIPIRRSRGRVVRYCFTEVAITPARGAAHSRPHVHQPRRLAVLVGHTLDNGLGRVPRVPGLRAPEGSHAVPMDCGYSIPDRGISPRSRLILLSRHCSAQLSAMSLRE